MLSDDEKQELLNSIYSSLADLPDLIDDPYLQGYIDEQRDKYKKLLVGIVNNDK